MAISIAVNTTPEALKHEGKLGIVKKCKNISEYKIQTAIHPFDINRLYTKEEDYPVMNLFSISQNFSLGNTVRNRNKRNDFKKEKRGMV